MENLNRSFEPMDVDVSVPDIMDVSFDLTNDDWEFASACNEQTNLKSLPVEQTTIQKKSVTVKKYHINFQRDKKQVKIKNYFILAGGLTLILSLIIAPVKYIRCKEEIDLEHLSSDLLHTVYGQSKAIETLIEALKVEGSKLLFFYGGTGVGKTFTATQLMEKFEPATNLYHYTMPSFRHEFSVELLFGLILCRTSLFIIDDLGSNDMQIREPIQDLIDKSAIMEKSVTIILIYNCMNMNDMKCDENFHKKLVKHFDSIKIIKKVIKFDHLNNEHLKKCIENELGHEISKDLDLSIVMKNFNVETDGCKGVHNKMKLLNIIN